MIQYKQLLKKILDNGEISNDRTGVGTLSLFGEQVKYDLREGFPLTTIRPTSLKIAFWELMMMLNGQTDTTFLRDRGIHIWDGNTNKDFQVNKAGLHDLKEWDMGLLYGKQLRNFNSSVTESCPDISDQLVYIIQQLIEDPNTRRAIYTHYNPAEVYCGVMFPCHMSGNFRRYGDNLDLQVYIRSNDMIYGHPYNVAYYALFLTFIARLIGCMPRVLTIQIGDAHIYNNQIEMAQEMVTRIPKELPKLKVLKSINTLHDILEMDFENLKLENYNPWPDFKNKPKMAA